MKKKKELIIILGSLLVVVLSVSIAYFTTTINSKNSNVSTSSAELKIVFTSGTGTIAGAEIEPGWSSGVNTFTVKNQGNGTYKYNIVIKDLINTFVTTGYLQYKITSTDGGYNMSDFTDVPKSKTAKDKVLAYSVEIAKGATHTYNVEFRYLNSTTVNQNEDMGKKLSGTLFIEEGTIDIHSPYEEGTLGWQMLDDNPVRAVRDNFNSVLGDDTTGTLYSTTEKNIHNTTDTTVYYYAGKTTNNWLKFGGFYWRIMRTNADKSIRLLYSGKVSEGTAGTKAYIGASVFNSKRNDSMYVGYMYGTSGTLTLNRTNENDSIIKGVIDTWYKNNLNINYGKYISTEAVYCNDREVGEGTYKANGWPAFYYASYSRLDKIIMTPSYNCTNSKDAFSGSNTEAKLKYPIALMTADEIAYAGGYARVNYSLSWYFWNSSGNKIIDSSGWWLLSPRSWTGTYAGPYSISWDGNISDSYTTSDSKKVRPVISINGDVLYSSGDGSPENPYEIVCN